MDGHVDETSHVIFLGKFEKDKRYKEKILQEIIAAIYAMLNSNGGQVMINIDTDSNVIPVEAGKKSRLQFNALLGAQLGLERLSPLEMRGYFNSLMMEIGMPFQSMLLEVFRDPLNLAE
ncbi:Hypothetical predicted protein [Paramuricea clavata]|uniref:Uncharacterized protein n=1 Tax=Paramuricea clavata TaxID=317549 RepID=A0A6S7JMM5_PARCT|nr:Hypothetical predicted protein [Paramuricea clavata]